jgi:leucyl aminopeptidase
MRQLTIDTDTTPPEQVDGVVALLVASEDDQPVVGGDLAAVTNDAAGALLTALHATGKADEVTRVPLPLADRTRLVLVAGVGAEPDTSAVRSAAAAAARAAVEDRSLTLVVPADLPGGLDVAGAARAMAEGAGFGAYAFTDHRTSADDAPVLEHITLVPGAGVDADVVAGAVSHADVVVRATNLTRDLVNTPPGFKRPPQLADRIAQAFAGTRVDVHVHDEAALADGGFGGLLGVGRGSHEPPRLVELRYEGTGEGQHQHVVLVGKGITFDTGGLSLKPSTGMNTMKSDMSGAAAVAGAVLAAAELGLAPRVTGLLALAENMPGGDATRVSDVLTHRGGTTVEVMNTDAEGRLVLADALAYGTELAPTAMIDLATLTGGQIVALGYRIAALLGTDDALLSAVEAAGEAAGERLWRLPLPDDYREQLRSEVADLQNIGKPREAQTIVAGLFLREFTGDVPWAHLDIAGPAFSESGDHALGPKGATGFGVRTVVAYLEALA